MVSTTFILDLTRGTAGAADTLAACRAMTCRDWDVLAAYANPDGAETARLLAREGHALSAFEAGSGTGVCDWEAALRSTSSNYVVFLRPGDRLAADALERWQRVIERQRATWVLGACPSGLYNDWWFQRDLSHSATALLAIGAAFPDCTALCRRDGWLDAVAQLPEVRDDGTRASAWFAMARASTPALLPEIVATTPHLPSHVSADTLVRVLSGLARRDPEAAGRLMADISRIGAGMRIGLDALLDALRTTERCFGRSPAVHDPEGDWLARTQLFEALLTRGQREIWIWGAGQAGLEALTWLSSRRVPVTGFLDRNASRDGSSWGGLPVRHVERVVRAIDDVGRAAREGNSTPLVVVASMYHAEISAELERRGWVPGRDFVVLRPDVQLLADRSLAS